MNLHRFGKLDLDPHRSQKPDPGSASESKAGAACIKVKTRELRRLSREPWMLTLELWRLSMEPSRLSMEQWRLTIEPKRLTTEL
jgi:hypothetical protein